MTASATPAPPPAPPRRPRRRSPAYLPYLLPGLVSFTVINLVLMVPTFITSFFGMNVPLPFSSNGWVGIFVISGGCILTTIITALMLRDRTSIKK